MRQKGIGSKGPLTPEGGIKFVSAKFNSKFLLQKSLILGLNFFLCFFLQMQYFLGKITFLQTQNSEIKNR